jgi:hypothetical protein
MSFGNARFLRGIALPAAGVVDPVSQILGEFTKVSTAHICFPTRTNEKR